MRSTDGAMTNDTTLAELLLLRATVEIDEARLAQQEREHAILKAATPEFCALDERDLQRLLEVLNG